MSTSEIKNISKTLCVLFAVYVLLFHFWQTMQILGLVSFIAIILSIAVKIFYGKIKDLF